MTASKLHQEKEIDYHIYVQSEIHFSLRLCIITFSLCPFILFSFILSLRLRLPSVMITPEGVMAALLFLFFYVCLGTFAYPIIALVFGVHICILLLFVPCMGHGLGVSFGV